MSSILSVVKGRKKQVLENSVSKAPASYWIRCLLNMVAEKLLGIFILLLLYKTLLFSLEQQ